MKKGIRSKNNIKVIGIEKYVKNKSIRDSVLTVITPLGIKHYFKGKEIDRKDFNKCFPLTLVPINYKGENPDKRKIK